MPTWEKMHLRTAGSVQPVTFISLNYLPSDTVAHSCCKVMLTFSNHLPTAGCSLWIDFGFSSWNSMCRSLVAECGHSRLLQWHLCNIKNNREFKILTSILLEQRSPYIWCFSLHRAISVKANQSFASFSLVFRLKEITSDGGFFFLQLNAVSLTYVYKRRLY